MHPAGGSPSPHESCGSVRWQLRSGRGMMRYANGDIYEGMFVAEKREGKGRLVYLDGSEYDGSWKANRREGHGRAVCKEGEVYEG